MDQGDVQLCLRTLGGTLRALRMERGYSLGDVAQGTELSTSFLSLVENGRSDISTGRLFRIARFLGVGLGDLLDMEPARDVTVVRAHERRAVAMPFDGIRMHPVINDHDGVAMAPVICEYDVGAQVVDMPRMEGVEHFLFVTDGSIRIVLEQNAPLVLEAGDCAYFGSQRVLEAANAGDGVATVLWVSTPPAFTGTAPPLTPTGAAGHAGRRDGHARRAAYRGRSVVDPPTVTAPVAPVVLSGSPGAPAR